MATAKSRKKKQQDFDKVRATQVKKVESAGQDHLISRAQQLIDEGHDDVKDMNKMMLYSKVVTIRDKQLDE